MNLNQVTIPSTDLTVSVPFYQKLGLKLIVDSVPRYARFECPDGEATFSIHRVEERIAGPGVVVYFECKNLDQYVSTLQSEGILFDSLPQDQTWRWREAHLSDPDGNQLILYYAGQDRKYPPWRIG